MSITEKEVEERIERLQSIKEEVCEIFSNNDMDLGEVMSLLTSLIVSIGLGQAEANPLRIIEVLAGGMTKYIQLNNAEKEKEGKQWLN